MSTTSDKEHDAQAAQDARYLSLFTAAVMKSAAYRPRFGQGKSGGVSLEDFQKLYGSDPFYSWVGLDSPLMYAAHKAAGGMTSIYRQVGVGCERIFQAVLCNTLKLTPQQASWKYETVGANGKPRFLKLDGRIQFQDVNDSDARDRLENWFRQSAAKLLIEPDLQPTLEGVVFEVRQGYKSMDSKRQNADISNASSAYLHRYMPVLVLVSTQIDATLLERYQGERWLMLRGMLAGQTTESTYAFCREVIGYDLAAFFQRNSTAMKETITAVLSALLKA